MAYQIKRWDNGKVIHEHGKTVKECLEHGIKNGVIFNHASLNGASLNRASLNGASLNHASGIYFSKFDMHIAYATRAGILIGCKWHSVNHWLKNYKEIGRNSEYSEIQIEMYGAWIKIVAENLKRQL